MSMESMLRHLSEQEQRIAAAGQSDLDRLVQAAALEAKLASVAAAERKSIEEVRAVADLYIQGGDNRTVLPIADRHSSTAFGVTEPLAASVIDGGTPVARLVTGRGDYVPTGDPVRDAALKHLAGMETTPVRHRAVARALEEAGHRAGAAEPEAASAPPAESGRRESGDAGVIAMIGRVHDLRPLSLRCLRAFIQPEQPDGAGGFLPPLLVLTLGAGGAAPAIAPRERLVVHLVPVRERDSCSMVCVYLGNSFVDRAAGVRYVCLSLVEQSTDGGSGNDDDEDRTIGPAGGLESIIGAGG
jgi:hypothetical protein